MTFKTRQYEAGLVAHYRRKSRVGIAIIVESMPPETEKLSLYRGVSSSGRQSENEQELSRLRLGRGGRNIP